MKKSPFGNFARFENEKVKSMNGHGKKSLASKENRNQTPSGEVNMENDMEVAMLESDTKQGISTDRDHVISLLRGMIVNKKNSKLSGLRTESSNQLKKLIHLGDMLIKGARSTQLRYHESSRLLCHEGNIPNYKELIRSLEDGVRLNTVLLLTELIHQVSNGRSLTRESIELAFLYQVESIVNLSFDIDHAVRKVKEDVVELNRLLNI